ncbi:polysaccharide biosynthesis protein [Methanocaldococcus bathoardescens]|uniref:Polysaccharide biosynthesis protein n=1 Tax=Methanocaldococcus bathoardescens TaxID=1301915 RepID=A0A076L9C1_9EURY|nr:flippase [Methanocaldococcus bathoardescens]AIJ04925.1 polysaccharide biosynthesis protein [Methanocaldococcus bathoardescens]
MSEAKKALFSIARGAGLIFFGTVFSMFFGFLSRIIIARHYTTFEYGIFSLSLTILSVVMVLVSLGLPEGVVREIGFYKDKDISKVKEIIFTSLFIISLSSLVFMILTFFSSDFIAKIFHQDELSVFLEILSFTIPFSAISGIIISFSRGFGRVKERIYLQSVLYPILWFILVLSLFIFNLSIIYLFYAFLLSQILTCLITVLYVYYSKFLKISFSLNLNLAKELLVFSIPLLLVSILAFIMNWTDILMVGYYLSSEFVGFYNTAAPLARLIPIFLDSAAFLYAPIVSGLYASGKIEDMKTTYQILTKWIFLATLPIFAMMFLFPKAVIGFFFGVKYLEASDVLRILSLGFMFHTFLGLNGLSLIVIKESRFIMVSNTISAILNIILNVLLIPKYGINGAAVATAVSYFIANILTSIRLYQKTKIHPFSRNYVKLLIISFIMLFGIQAFGLDVSNILYAILILVTFFLSYMFLVLLSKCVDKEDIELFLVVERKLGVNLWIIKRILKKFV